MPKPNGKKFLYEGKVTQVNDGKRINTYTIDEMYEGISCDIMNARGCHPAIQLRSCMASRRVPAFMKNEGFRTVNEKMAEYLPIMLSLPMTDANKDIGLTWPKRRVRAKWAIVEKKLTIENRELIRTNVALM